MPQKSEGAQWDGKSRGGSLGHKIFVWLLKHAGLNAAFVLLAFVAFWFALFSRTGAKAQYNLFRRRLQYPFFKALWHVYKNHYTFGKILIDKVALFSGLAHKYSFEHQNSEVIRKMITDKTGGILLNAHIGSWEAAGRLLKRYGGRIYILMVQAEHEQIKQILETTNQASQIEIIAIQDDGSHLAKVREVLINKGIIAMHGDRYLEGNQTVEHNFLGKPAKFPSGPYHLAAQYKVPLSFATAFRQKGRHYIFHAMEPIYVDRKGKPESRKKEIFEKSALYVRELEKVIRLYPTQWFNYYDFWETSQTDRTTEQND